MIIKHRIVKNPHKENLDRLVDYQLHGRDGMSPTERVLYQGTLNCISDDPFDAKLEISQVASRNKRARKTEDVAHLIISLRPGEKLSEEQWLDCAQEILSSLGMSEHQAFFYVHRDTDQEHMHLCINKINPHDFTKNSLSNEYRKLMRAAEHLEKRYALSEVEHGIKNTKAEKLAKEFEKVTGQQSFLSYLRNFMDEMLRADTWQELHKICAEHGVSLKKVGRGLLFSALDQEKEYLAKASSVDRQLSYSKLSQRFGDFVPFDGSMISSKEHYEATPVGYNANQDRIEEIYKKYRELQNHNRIMRRDLLAEEKLRFQEAKQRINEIIRKARNNARFEFRQDLAKLQKERGRLERIRKNRLNEEYIRHRNKEKEIKKKFRTMNFQDFLRHYDDLKDPLRDILLSRDAAGLQDGLNKITGASSRIEEEMIVEMRFFSFRKRTTKGQDIFTSALSRGDLIRDDGFKIILNNKPSLITVSDALILAKNRFTDHSPLEIAGSLNFQKQCAIIAAQEKINIRLENVKAQAYFEKLKEDLYERRQLTGKRDFRGDLAGRGSEYGGSFFRQSSFFEHSTIFRYRRSQFTGSDQVKSKQFNDAAASRMHMSKMSMGAMDGDHGQSDVFLQTDPYAGMAGGRPKQFDQGVRRTVHTASPKLKKISPEMIAAMTVYMTERNQKHKLGVPGIQEHKIWNEQDGYFEYLGLRNKKDQTFLLFRQGEIVYIKPASVYEKRRLKQLGSHTKVKITSTGKISVVRKQKIQKEGSMHI